MAVTHVHTFLVHPQAVVAEIGGSAVLLEGKLFNLLNKIYETSEGQCNIDVAFNIGGDGQQANAVRALLIDYTQNPDLQRGRSVAAQLGSATDGRSGMGLLFLIRGVEGQEHRLIVSRFPADNGILAEANNAELTVEFLERVFMKSAKAYKAALYQDASFNTGFWHGRVIDRQVSDPVARVSEYWIKGFLDSDFRTTPAHGTRRLALALKETMRSSDLEAKQALSAAATLAAGINGQQTSIADFQERFGLPEPVRAAMNASVRSPVVLAERFVFDAAEFQREVAYRSVELDSGAILTAQSGDFDEIFNREELDAGGKLVRFSTTGEIVGERLRRKALT